MARATRSGRSRPPPTCAPWRRRSSRVETDSMSASPAEQPLPTGAQKWTIIGTVLVGAFVFSLNARGSILESPVIVQAFALDHYKNQWITGAEAVAGLTTLFAGI